MALYPYSPTFSPYGYQRQDYMQQPLQQQIMQPQTAVQASQNSFLCRAVTSREEAAVAQIPFDGTPSYFVDTANGKIYVKAFRPDGTAPLITFIREDEPAPLQFATVDQLMALEAKINGIKQMLMTEEKTHEQYDS